MILNVYNDFNLPIDPTSLTTMSEYNLSLILFSNIVFFDWETRVYSTILKSWDYDEKNKTYLFEISEKAQWSDGRPVTSDDLELSILRLKRVSPTNYLAIDSLIDGKTEDDGFGIPSNSGIRKIDNRLLEVQVLSESRELFSRLASGIAPIVRYDQLDVSSLAISRHHVACGPYRVVNISDSPSELKLARNEFFPLHTDESFQGIVLRPTPEEGIALEDFFDEESWPSVLTNQSFISNKMVTYAREHLFPVWTRPYDRVTVKMPAGERSKLAHLKTVLSWVGGELQSNGMDFRTYFGVERAFSLQPPGFALSQQIVYPRRKKPEGAEREFHIAFFGRAFLGRNRHVAEMISNQLKEIGLRNVISIHPFTELRNLQYSRNLDFIVTEFGAADPDPVVWLSLVLDSRVKFIGDYDGNLKNEFKQIIEGRAGASRDTALTELLVTAGLSGVYLPIAHCSSVAIGKPYVSFTDIWATDETVDFGKLRNCHR